MMHRKLRLLTLLTGLALLALLLIVQPALAQGTSTNGATSSAVGNNLAGTMSDIAQPVLIAMAGVMGIGALAKRDTGSAFTLLIITIVVGGFAFAPHQIAGFIETLWSEVFRNSVKQ